LKKKELKRLQEEARGPEKPLPVPETEKPKKVKLITK